MCATTTTHTTTLLLLQVRSFRMFFLLKICVSVSVTWSLYLSLSVLVPSPNCLSSSFPISPFCPIPPSLAVSPHMRMPCLRGRDPHSPPPSTTKQARPVAAGVRPLGEGDGALAQVPAPSSRVMYQHCLVGNAGELLLFARARTQRHSPVLHPPLPPRHLSAHIG